jgi:peroxiredoxin/cytidylate kinase
MLILIGFKTGDKAPDFTLPDTENRTRSLKEFLGQKVVLVFFVGAFTLNCTKEVCEFRDSMSQLINLKAQVVGIDVNVPSKNKLLAEKNRLQFPILSDNKRDVFKAYGLDVPDYVGVEGEPVACRWGDGCYPTAKRSIFVLDENGIIRYIWASDIPESEPDYAEIGEMLQQISLEERMPSAHNIITISRQAGSGGDEIAEKVSELLGYAYFDKGLLMNVAKCIGVSEEDIADFSEDVYTVKSLVDKILLREKPAAISIIQKGDEVISKTLDEEKCLSVIQTVINSLAGRGNAVIVGRGGQAILKHKVGVLHVRIIAPLTDRIERIMKTKALTKEAAQKLIEDHDRASAEYLHRFYGISWDDPAIYDIILNTWKMDQNTAAEIIASAASKKW